MGVLEEMNHTPSKGSAGRSKTPLKSPRAAPVGTMSPNDDAAERRKSKLAGWLLRTGTRPSLRPLLLCILRLCQH
jgi:hypothetical protein